uniref:Uncharacterized protein n=1 Tax=Oryza sativa subsp. japonica TaxID=39947 RepID=Q6Z686_ORYSJ|nr:unknown protein [Oryza sativa Japonica Group]
MAMSRRVRRRWGPYCSLLDGWKVTRRYCMCRRWVCAAGWHRPGHEATAHLRPRSRPPPLPLPLELRGLNLCGDEVRLRALSTIPATIEGDGAIPSRGGATRHHGQRRCAAFRRDPAPLLPSPVAAHSRRRFSACRRYSRISAARRPPHHTRAFAARRVWDAQDGRASATPRRHAVAAAEGGAARGGGGKEARGGGSRGQHGARRRHAAAAEGGTQWHAAAVGGSE